MVESVLHFFKIHRKMISGNPAVVVENMLGIAPKTLNAVNVICGTPTNEGFVVIDRVMFAQSFQRVVASEGVRVVHRSFSRFLSDNRHEFFLGNMLNHSRIHLAIALQQAKYHIFARCAPAASPLASAAEVALVHLHLAVQFVALKLGDMIDRFAEALVHAGNRLVVAFEIVRKAVSGLLLVESLHDGNLHSDAAERFLFSTALVSAPDVSASRPRDLERTAEYALLSPQIKKLAAQLKTFFRPCAIWVF